MKRFLAVFIIGGLALLSACGGDKPPITPPITPPPSTGVVTPIGTNIGSPVVGSIDASGGTLSAGEVTVSAPAGAFSNANLTLQPISDTFNDAGQGIAISSDASWDKYLTVTFAIDPSEDSPESLSLAVQQSDGSWRALEPVKVDLIAGTVSAGLPADTEVGTARVRAQGLLDLKRVIKFKKYYFKPASATVKVGKTQTFVPFAQVLERPKSCPKTTPDPDVDLTPLAKCFKPVTREYPFTNDKDGFTRAWSVNGIFKGDSTVGTIAPSSGSGAVYTAPDKKPSPDTVTVSFLSANIDTFDSVSIKPPAKVKIIEDFMSGYTGSVGFSFDGGNGTTVSGVGTPIWTKILGRLEYELEGSMTITITKPNCAAATAIVPTTGRLTLYDAAGSGRGAAFANKYYFQLGQLALVTGTAHCGQPPQPTRTEERFFLFSAQTACPLEDQTLSVAPKYSDPLRLTGSGSWTCLGATAEVNWNLQGN